MAKDNPVRHRIPGIKKGDTITAKPFLMSIINQLNGDLDDFQPPRQIDSVQTDGESAKLTHRLQIVSEQNDYLVCFDTSTNPVLVFVAKPTRLQGATATRTVNGEAQIIIPPYTTGQFIFGFNDIEGGTNTIGNGVLLTFMDLNVDARAWAEDT